MTISMHFWEPNKIPAVVGAVATAADVEQVADNLLALYHSTGLLPGIELRADTGDSLSIAVGSEGWALIHTDSKFVQYCTKNTVKDDNTDADVRWEEVTSIPTAWFIPKALALAGLKQWLADGSRSLDLPWSDECV